MGKRQKSVGPWNTGQNMLIPAWILSREAFGEEQDQPQQVHTGHRPGRSRKARNRVDDSPVEPRFTVDCQEDPGHPMTVGTGGRGSEIFSLCNFFCLSSFSRDFGRTGRTQDNSLKPRLTALIQVHVCFM
jgi:hypothetical protein